MYYKVLATLATLSLLGIFIILACGMYKIHSGDHLGKKCDLHKEKSEKHYDYKDDKNYKEDKEEKGDIKEKVENLEKTLEQVTRATEQNIFGLQNLTFFLTKVVEKNYSEEERKSLMAEYDKILKDQQEAYQKSLQGQGNVNAENTEVQNQNIETTNQVKIPENIKKNILDTVNKN
jgi:hypothetical protein